MWQFFTIKVKVKVQLSLSLIKYHDMKLYGGVKVHSTHSWHMNLMEENGQIHTLASFPVRKEPFVLTE
jgi:hypothetical protein